MSLVAGLVRADQTGRYSAAFSHTICHPCSADESRVSLKERTLFVRHTAKWLFTKVKKIKTNTYPERKYVPNFSLVL